MPSYLKYFQIQVHPPCLTTSRYLLEHNFTYSLVTLSSSIYYLISFLPIFWFYSYVRGTKNYFLLELVSTLLWFLFQHLIHFILPLPKVQNSLLDPSHNCTTPRSQITQLRNHSGAFQTCGWGNRRAGLPIVTLQLARSNNGWWFQSKKFSCLQMCGGGYNQH